MDVQTIFKRYELKYLLTKEQKDRLLEKLQENLIPDPHGETTIRNIYFDTENCAVFLLYQLLELGSGRGREAWKTLTIIIPEDLDYTEVFSDILKDYTSSHTLVCVKTTNMGSLFRLTYEVVLRDIEKEKEMIDKLRCRNGNLEISLARQEALAAEL